MSYSRLDQILRGSKKMETDKNVKPDPEKDVDKDKKKDEEDPEEMSDEELERRQAALEKKAKEAAERDARREQFVKRCQKIISIVFIITRWNVFIFSSTSPDLVG